jgi:hypothetical protein
MDDGITETNNKRPPVIALGLCFFGSCYLIGLFAFLRRSRRLNRVKANRRSRELAKQEAEAAEEREERKRRKQQDAGGSANANGDDGAAAAAAAAASPTDVELLQVAVRELRDHERSAEDLNMGSAEQMPKAV